MQTDPSTAPSRAVQRLRARPGGGLAPAGAPARRWRPTRAARGSTGGRIVYAVGDVHGRLDLLKALLERIAADAGGQPYLIVLSGDYIDRGPDSARVLEHLIGLRRRYGEDVFLLKGNHEQALLRFLDDPASGGAWLERFGGDATLRSYGVAPPEPGASVRELAAARDDLLETMPASHLKLLQDLDLMVVVGDYAFAHAGVSPDAPLAEQTEDDLLWARGELLDGRRAIEKIVVHGHTWQTDRPELLGHRIGLDTGAYETGVLTAVRIEDDRRGVLQAMDTAAELRRAEEVTAPRRLVKRPADYVRLSPAELAMFATPALSRSPVFP